MIQNVLLTSGKTLFIVVGLLMWSLSVVSLTHCALELGCVVRLFKLFAN